MPSPTTRFPLDRALALPACSFSYELQGRLVKAAVQNPFLESVQTIAELTGVSVSKRSLEKILQDAAQDFDAFYQQRSVATAAGSVLVAAVDGKGIPMVKPGGAQSKARLTKGQKANAWPRWLPSSTAHLGCGHRNKYSYFAKDAKFATRAVEHCPVLPAGAESIHRQPNPPLISGSSCGWRGH
jgi:hypothetical protein